jgi:putative CocE/NonD family hydrolase
MSKKAIKKVENIKIKMNDGINLSATAWMPADAYKKPVPAVFEIIPYRKNDVSAQRDLMIHPCFAEAGYISLRIDIRGSGDSEGVLHDEYLQRELEDGIEIINWLADQQWCSGEVGMIGISWGGFSGLQLAALQPEPLKAVVTLCSTDDRYADDVHYMGGCLLLDNFSWASTMFDFNSTPPDPVSVGQRWFDLWEQRLENSGLWVKNWLEHQKKDFFWKHGSVCEDYSKIKCPVFAVSGWADGYSNSVFRLVENLSSPVKGLVGPWNHKYPHLGGPGPSIDFIKECIRWWDFYLKGIDNGVKNDPKLTLWMQDSFSPYKSERPGRFVALDEWPSTAIKPHEYSISGNKLLKKSLCEKNDENEKISIKSPLSTGFFAGKWCSYAESTDLPKDQREDDGGSILFDSGLLDQEFEIAGAVTAELEISSDQPQSMVAVRLCDVDPDGNSSRVSYGLLNLTHRNSHEFPEELEPFKKYKVRVKLNYAAHCFKKGHRLRIAVSSSYWPLAWPSPEPAEITIYTDNSVIFIPEIDTSEAKNTVFDPPPSDLVPDKSIELKEPAYRSWNVNYNLASNQNSLNVINKEETFFIKDKELEFGSTAFEKYSYTNNSYDSLKAEMETRRSFKRKEDEIYIITKTVMKSDKKNFMIKADLDAYKNETRIYTKTWDENIPRDFI